MKRDAKEQLKKKSIDELRHVLLDMKEKTSRLLFDLKSGKTAVLKELRLLRKDTALCMTIIREKETKKQD